MILAIIYAFIVIFCIIGICDFLFGIKLFFISPDEKPCNLILLQLDADDFKMQIYSVLQKKNWYGNVYCDYIVALTDNLSDEELEECKNHFKNEDIAFFKNLKEFEESDILRKGYYA